MHKSLYSLLIVLPFAFFIACEDNKQIDDGYNICDVTNPDWFMVLALMHFIC